MDRTLQFERDAKKILNEEVPDSKRLEKFLETGYNLDIDLAEIPQLKQVSLNFTVVCVCIILKSFTIY